METQQLTGNTQAATRRVPSASPSGALRRDLHHRAQVCAIVTDLLMAARCGKVDEYLRPMPITRLHMAQRAFREIGATRLASALHVAQFSLTRVGVRVPFAQAVATLTAAPQTRTEDVDRLMAQFL